MKTSLVLVSLFASTFAGAKTVADIPSINFGVAKVLVTDVCEKDGNLLTKLPVTYCASSGRNWVSTGPRRSEGYFETICHSEETEVLSRATTYLAKKCVRWEGRRSENICRKYEEITKTIPLTYQYGIYKVHTRQGERFRKLLETKSISIPTCL